MHAHDKELRNQLIQLAHANPELDTLDLKEVLHKHGLTYEECVERFGKEDADTIFGIARGLAKATEYKDIDGRPVSLDVLCRGEPAWAANNIKRLEADRKALREALRDVCENPLSLGANARGRVLVGLPEPDAAGITLFKWPEHAGTCECSDCAEASKRKQQTRACPKCPYLGNFWISGWAALIQCPRCHHTFDVPGDDAQGLDARE